MLVSATEMLKKAKEVHSADRKGVQVTGHPRCVRGRRQVHGRISRCSRHGERTVKGSGH